MTERKRLRNQITLGAVFGVLMVVKMFWDPKLTSLNAVWAGRALLAAAAGVFFWLAGTKWMEYREKYPRP